MVTHRTSFIINPLHNNFAKDKYNHIDVLNFFCQVIIIAQPAGAWTLAQTYGIWDFKIHFILFKGQLAIEEWERQIAQAQKNLYSEAIELGGRITTEHGVGLLRKSYLSMNLGSSQIEVLKRLKRAFDPKNILNPGKIFDL